MKEEQLIKTILTLSIVVAFISLFFAVFTLVTVIKRSVKVTITKKPTLPQCNEDWPQSYSNLVIQPCPTPTPTVIE